MIRNKTPTARREGIKISFHRPPFSISLENQWCGHERRWWQSGVRQLFIYPWATMRLAALGMDDRCLETFTYSPVKSATSQ